MRWLLGILVVFGLMLHNVPYLVRDLAVGWLRDQGADEARLKALKINWFTGEIEVQELYAARVGQTPLALKQLYLQLDYAALTEQRLQLSGFSVNGLHGALVEQEDALWLGPLDLNALAGSEDNAEPEASSSSPWLPGVNQIRLQDIRWLTAVGGQSYKLELDQAALDDLYFWRKEQPTQLNLSGRINGAPIELSSELTPLPENKKSILNLKLSRFPLHSVTALFVPELRALVDLDMKIDASLAGEDLRLRPEGTLSVNGLQWQAQEISLKQQALSWQGVLDVALLADKAPALSAKGTLTGQGLDLKLPEQQIQLAGLSLGLDTTLQAAQRNVAQTGPLTLKQLQYQGPGITLEQAALDWQGKVALQLTPMANLSVKGALNGENLSLLQGEKAVKLASYQLAPNVASKDLSAFSIQLPRLVLGQSSVSVGENPLLALGRVALEQADIQLPVNAPLKVKTGALALDKLLVLGPDQHLLTLDKTRLSSLSFVPEQAATLGALKLQGLDANVLLSETGQLPDLQWLQQQLAGAEGAEPARTETKTTAAAEEGEPLHLQLASFDLVGQNQIRIQDRSTTPAFKSTIDLETITLGAVDTQAETLTPFGVQAVINQFGRLELRGEARADASQGNWTLNLSGLSLPPLSPYAERFTGYYLNSGQLNLKSNGDLAGDRLEGKNQISINNLTVDQRDADKVAALSQKITMPLETAIMVLEDNDNNIVIDVPLSGSLSDPQFGYQSIINNLAAKGLKNAAMGFLTKSLQPYATLISLASSAIDASNKGAFITLNPITFAAGEATLNRDAKAYLAKLSEMLNERKAMRLNICGRAVVNDEAVLWPQLQANNKKRKKPLAEDALKAELPQALQTLAEQRAAAVKALLDKQVASDRLFLCMAQVDRQVDAQARVELKL